jgi:hypothetical protein
MASSISNPDEMSLDSIINEVNEMESKIKK